MRVVLRVLRAALHSFRHTFNNPLRDLGMGIEDRRVLMGHAANSSNMIYTHPNPELAREFVNRIAVRSRQ